MFIVLGLYALIFLNVERCKIRHLNNVIFICIIGFRLKTQVSYLELPYVADTCYKAQPLVVFVNRVEELELSCPIWTKLFQILLWKNTSAYDVVRKCSELLTFIFLLCCCLVLRFFKNIVIILSGFLE